LREERFSRIFVLALYVPWGRPLKSELREGTLEAALHHRRLHDAFQATLGSMTDLDDSSPSAPSGVELEPAQLSVDALRGLVEEYVTREGTDYGHSDWSLDDKVAQVYQQLDRGEAKIVFDLELQTASIVAAPELTTPRLDD
jgi:uncharacterized protein YheU (UPF0270 family)